MEPSLFNQPKYTAMNVFLVTSLLELGFEFNQRTKPTNDYDGNIMCKLDNPIVYNVINASLIDFID
ncbi:hypothetical protein BLOT_015100 [Blomia tropicalis]|nr:hypothetical protein BLOT_015100 [Blomia tropicalis]